MTNTAPTNAYRGAGRPEANYIVERLVDEAAAKLEMDPFELRRRNMIKKTQFPYKTLTGAMFDSADFHALVAKAKEEADWKGFAARRRQSKKAGKLRGIGTAVFIEPSGGGGMKKDEVAVLFDKDGRATIHNVAGSSGQAHETVFPELVARWLGIDAEKIVSKSGRSGRSAFDRASIDQFALGVSQGSAFKVAADIIIEKARKIAADELEAGVNDIEFANGVFTIAGTDRSMTMTRVIEKSCAVVPSPLDTVAERGISMAFPSGAHVVEVEIDPDTGKVDVVSYIAVDDMGNVINQVLADGQVVGGIVQGAGQVLGENCQYDETDGQLLYRQLHGLLHAARRSHSVRRAVQRRGAVAEQPARRQRRRRSRLDRLAAGLHECGDECFADGGREAFRHAGDAVADLGRNSGSQNAGGLSYTIQFKR